MMKTREAFFSILFAAAALATARPVVAADLDPLSAILPLASYRGQAETRSGFDGRLQHIFEFARDDAAALTEDGFLAMLQRRRAATISAFLLSDLNNDLQVTNEERGGASSQYGTEVIDYLKLMAVMDINLDGVITLDEARKVADWRLRDGDDHLHSIPVVELLRKLDPNGDGVLTAAEVEKIGAAAFAIYDVDGNGMLSQSESGRLDRQREVVEAEMQFRAEAERCIFPAVGSNERVFLVSANSANTLSSVTVATQYRVTQTAEIAIEAGDEPLYIMAASAQPMIWRVTGHTERVTHFVAASPAGAGAIGVSREKTTFGDYAECFGYGYHDLAPRNRKDLLERLVGRPIDGAFIESRMQKVSVPSMAADPTTRKTSDKSPKPVLPPFSMGGLASSDAETIHAFRLEYPGGLQRFDPATIVASGEAAEYQLLPGAAGLLQLLEDGSIESQGGGVYRIRKPFPVQSFYFSLPRDTRFVLPLDVQMTVDKAFRFAHMTKRNEPDPREGERPDKK